MEVLKFGYYFTGLTTTHAIVDSGSYNLLMLSVLLGIAAQWVFITGQ